MLKNIFFVITAILMASQVNAAVIFNPSVFYYTRSEKQGSTETEFNQQVINLKLGYLSPSGLYLGAVFDTESREYGSGAADEDRDSLGATLGYMSGAWSVLGSYYFQSEFEEYEGTGWAVDLGYIFRGGGLGIGPMLSYRHWEYNELNGASATPEREHNNLLPSIQFMASF